MKSFETVVPVQKPVNKSMVTKQMKTKGFGGVYTHHNNSDILAIFKFERVDSIHLTLLPNSPSSKIDLGFQLSLLNTSQVHQVENNWKIITAVCVCLYLIYCVNLYTKYRKKVGNAESQAYL